MKLAIILSILILSMIFIACSPPVRHWAMKPDQSRDEYWNDRQACNEEASAKLFHSRWSGINEVSIRYGTGRVLEKKYFDECMKLKGYEEEPR